MRERLHVEGFQNKSTESSFGVWGWTSVMPQCDGFRSATFLHHPTLLSSSPWWPLAQQRLTHTSQGHSSEAECRGELISTALRGWVASARVTLSLLPQVRHSGVNPPPPPGWKGNSTWAGNKWSSVVFSKPEWKRKTNTWLWHKRLSFTFNFSLTRYIIDKPSCFVLGDFPSILRTVRQ